MPWYLSMAIQVIVRMPVTMAVVCTKGTVLQTRTPARKKQTWGWVKQPKTLSGVVWSETWGELPLDLFIFLLGLDEITQRSYLEHTYLPSIMKLWAETQEKLCTVVRPTSYVYSDSPFTTNCECILMGAHALSWPTIAMIRSMSLHCKMFGCKITVNYWLLVAWISQ